MKKKVLFICTHNSARSQMAEGILNALHGDRYEGRSAGIEATRVNLSVVKVMAEIGIDISMHRSKSIEEFRGENFDYVVTVCDHAKEACPFFPGENIIHKSFEDPSKFRSTEKEMLKKTRDEIRDWIEKTFGKENLEKRAFHWSSSRRHVACHFEYNVR